jgi:hypothetical protein
MSLNLTVFKQKLKKHKGLHFDNQVVYRNVSAGFVKSGGDPLDSQSSFKSGYRFNFPDSFPALYFGLSEIVTVLEVGYRTKATSTRFDNTAKKPRETLSIYVTGNFVDLTDKRILKGFSFNPNRPEYLIPHEIWEDRCKLYRKSGFSKPAITHEIGKYVYEEGFDGIIYFSYPAWYLREKHPIHVVSAICIFMDKVDFCKPKNDSCTLQIYL